MVYLNENEGRERWASWAGIYTMYVLLALATAGAIILRRRRVLVWPLLSTAVIASITAASFYGIVRFRLPADVAMTALAAIPLGACAGRIVDRHRGRQAPIGGATAREPAGDGERPE
jgi:hypothetical protein